MNQLRDLAVNQEIEAGPMVYSSRGPVRRMQGQITEQSLTLTIDLDDATFQKILNTYRASLGTGRYRPPALPEILAILISEMH